MSVIVQIKSDGKLEAYLRIVHEVEVARWSGHGGGR